jgi:saccharopine dehydrogenase-like NADP-dependent oxidoreductase
MKILVIGAAGKMGKAVVSYLANDPDVSELGLLDVHEKALRSVIEGNPNGKLKSHPADIEDVNKLKEIMKDYDVGVVTLPNRKFSYKAIEAAIEAGLNLVDILEEYHRKPDSYETEGLVIPSQFNCGEEYGECLHEEAVKNDVLILDGMGFAPGLSNITVARGIGLMDVPISAVARVGGIPGIDCCAKHPLRYMTTWSIEHVLREYFVKTRIIKDGNVIEIQSLSEPETLSFKNLASMLS